MNYVEVLHKNYVTYETNLRGHTHMTSTLRGTGRIRQKWDVIGRRWSGLASLLDVQSLFFCLKNWICIMTRHHDEPNINILLTGNLSFDSDVRQWNRLFMIPLHFLWAKSNNGARGQFECDVTWFCVCFDFVPSHVLSGCWSIVFYVFNLCQKTPQKTGWLQNEY